MSTPYTTIIGLEVHVQLDTKSKLFCGCSTRFGAEPNTQTCPVCIGMPGTLPVMNREAFRLALKTALALNCEIPPFTKWDRKQYYYPDLPKNYQISQYDLPMSQHGYVDISDPKEAFAAKSLSQYSQMASSRAPAPTSCLPSPCPLPEGEDSGISSKRIRILRAHLEEDAGKSLHDEVAGKADSQIDLNRTGTPLLEIVTEPDLRSPAEAKVFLSELKLLLTYIGVSDCNMQEGSLRVDANVNLHIETQQGRVATPIVEIKNMNSFRAVERALDYEAQRQWRVWQETHQRLGDVPKQTRGWDDAAGVTRGQRSKEESSDYRYFPDPDLVPVAATPSELDEIRQSLGELPAAIRQRLQQQSGLPAYDADVLVNQGRPLVDYFLGVAAQCGDAKAAANWVTQDVLRTLKERQWSIAELTDVHGVSPEFVGELINRTRTGEFTRSQAKQVYDAQVSTTNISPEPLKAKATLQPVTVRIEMIAGTLEIKRIDESELVALCKQLLAANPKTIADVKAGKTQAIGALIGQAKKLNPNIDPTRVREICLELIQTAT